MSEPEKNKIQDEQVSERPSITENASPTDVVPEQDEENIDSGSNGNNNEDSGENSREKNGEKKDGKPVFDARNSLPGNKKNASEDTPQPMSRIFFLLLIIAICAWFIFHGNGKSAPIPYGMFVEQLEQGNIDRVTLDGNKVSGEFVVPPRVPKDYMSSGSGTTKKRKATDSATETLNSAESTQKTDTDTDADKTAKDDNTVKVEGADKASEEESAKKPEVATVPNSGKMIQLPKKFTTTLPSVLEGGGELDKKIQEHVGDKYNVRESLDAMGYMMLLSLIVTVILIGSIWFQFRRTRDQLGGGQMFGFGKSPAKRFQGGEGTVTFKDVAGLKSVKEDLSEIVDFLQNPQKFERLGARIPKGVLMCGPPGTGKTLLARAIAGEAGVPFYSINASEFIQMFVGVGASRVRDMFDVARSNAPSILFIDEIDAIGRYRGAGTGGGNDEREQTLNQILGEMDGFATTDLVIVMAATNRPDVLDPALLRPGRFDRHVTVDRPVHKDRIQLFKVHTRKVPLADDVDFDRLAAMTMGLTGADLRNIVNEAALWACRFNRDKVYMNDFYYAIDKIQMGSKREEVISDEEKEKTSYHEAGHTLVSWLTPDCDRVGKVSVIPRGRALGVTWSIPEEDRMMHSQREIYAKLKMMLGGREAEKLVFDELNAGAANDLERATEIVRKMVGSWGMSPRIGPATFNVDNEHPFLGKQMSNPQSYFSEKTAQVIDEEIMRILNEASQQVSTLLSEHRNMLDALAQALMIREELDETQIEDILGPPAYRKKREAK